MLLHVTACYVVHGRSFLNGAPIVPLLNALSEPWQFPLPLLLQLSKSNLLHYIYTPKFWIFESKHHTQTHNFVTNTPNTPMTTANMSAAVLIYVDHAPNPNTICSICLDPVAQKAIKVSCHLPLSCAECMGYWFESLNHSKSKTACPCCRINVDTSNLQAPSASIEWHDVENMMMDESEPEDFWGEFEDESSFSDDEQSDEEDGDVRSSPHLSCLF